MTTILDEAWRELVEKDDRTSPAEYPDMALITRDELAGFMALATPSTGAVGWDDPKESELEQRAFAAANGKDVPEHIRLLVSDLWKQYCLAAAPPSSPSERDAALEWKHDAPFITQVSQPDGKKFISVAVRDFDALHQAHDLIVSAFKAAGAK
jgi:hypothetical protein